MQIAVNVAADCVYARMCRSVYLPNSPPPDNVDCFTPPLSRRDIGDISRAVNTTVVVLSDETCGGTKKGRFTSRRMHVSACAIHTIVCQVARSRSRLQYVYSTFTVRATLKGMHFFQTQQKDPVRLCYTNQ